MANVLTGNPKSIDTAAGSTLSGLVGIKELQWIDNAGDIADGDDLSFTMNGVTVAMVANIGSDVGDQDIVKYRLGPFNPPLIAKDFVVNTIDHGVLLVFV